MAHPLAATDLAVFEETFTKFQRTWEDGSPFPLILCPRPGTPNGVGSLASRMQLDREMVDEMLQKQGAILFRGFNMGSAEEFNQVADAFGGENYPYSEIGGLAKRSKVWGRIITTSDDVPISQNLGFHNESAYVEKPPTRMMFFCVEPPELGTGGATPIVAGSILHQRLLNKHKVVIRELFNKGIMVIPKQENVSKRKAEIIANRKFNHTLPVIRKDRYGRTVWFSPQINGLGNVSKHGRIMLGDGGIMPKGVLETVVKVMEEEKVTFQWEKGDILLLDNTAVMHARQACTSSRTILLSMTK